MDEHPALAAAVMPETLASKTVVVHETIEPVAIKPVPAKNDAKNNISKKTGVKKTDTIELSQPVLAVRSNATGQHMITNVEKVVQPKASITVRLKVRARVGNIRSKPDKSGKVLFRLAQGAVVTKLGEQQGWFKVRLRNGTVAWGHRSIF
jgi:hypothetical protein